MIKIINGVFGYREGKSIIPKTSKDAPFECDKATEKRLVDLGVAKYVTAEVPVETHAEVAEEVETAELVEEAIEEPTRDELIAIFKEMGLKGNPSSMKTETLKAKIAEAAELVEDEEVDEDAPSFDDADGVVA